MANEFVARKGIISLGGLTFPFYQTATIYTANTDDYFIDFVSPSTVHLPTAVGIEGKQYVIRNSSNNNCTIDAFSNQTIDGSQTIILGVDSSIQIVSTGSNWQISNVGGPIRNFTNNALLTSDGTIGGVDANTGLTYNGKTLVINSPKSSADTVLETYTYNISGLTATTANTTIFSYPRTNLVSLKVDFRIVNTENISIRSGYFTKLTEISALQSFVSQVAGGTMYTIITATTDSSNTNIIIRTTQSTEIVNISLDVRSIKL